MSSRQRKVKHIEEMLQKVVFHKQENERMKKEIRELQGKEEQLLQKTAMKRAESQIDTLKDE